MIFINTSDNFHGNLNDHILSKNEIEAYVFNIINKYGLDYYITDVEFIDDNNNLGSYSFDTAIIKINIPKIIEEAKRLYEENKIDKNPILFINLNILEATLHEVMHGIQNYHLNESNIAYNILYAREIAYTNIISDELYDKYYYLFSYERDAIITSIENILQIIKTHYPDNERTFTYFLSNLYRYLVLGYTVDLYNIKSPAEKLSEELYHDSTPILSNIDLYDRMKLGYQVSYRKYKNFKRNKVRKILSKNNLL